MKHHNSIFNQLLKHLPRHRFQRAVDRHKGDYRARSLFCWDQLLVMLFAQLTGRQSLRDLEAAYNSQSHCHYHLGTRLMRRSSLADANASRPSAIFKEVFFDLLEKVRERQPCHKEANEMVRLIDSTTIDLNLEQYQWAAFRSTKAGIKLHTVYDPDAEVPVFFSMTSAKVNDRKALPQLPQLAGATYVFDRAYNDYSWYHQLDQNNCRFVGRMKSNARFEVVEARTVDNSGSVLSDQLIQLTADKARKDCPIKLRRIVFLREEDQKELVFITNDLASPASDIAALYKRRWQIELFFKWLKQNLKIKRFLGHSENAVLIQVLVAMIAYLLLKLSQLGSASVLRLSQIARLMSVNLTSRRCLWRLLQPASDGRCESPGEDLQLGLSFTKS